MKKTNKGGARRSVRRAARQASAAAEQGQGAVRDVWAAAVEAFGTAEAEAEKQLRTLVKSGRLTAREAKSTLDQFKNRLQKERKKAMRQVEDRLDAFQGRIEKERKGLVKVVDEAVRSALAAFNIPSRREVSELTRKVEELSAKIDGFRRTSRKPAARRRASAAA